MLTIKRKLKMQKELNKCPELNDKVIADSIDTLFNYLIGKIKKQQEEINSLNTIFAKMETMQNKLIKAYEEKQAYDDFTKQQMDTLFGGIKPLRGNVTDRQSALEKIEKINEAK